VTPGSRFDRWLVGDASALSAEELEGYRLFKTFGCSSCHQGRNVGGNLFERQGVFHPLVRGPPEIVRVPSLRNVAATAPYFHDGSAATLQEAVRRMARAQLDRTLTDPQIESIVGFLQTLTGNYHGSPVSGAPR
jgi:cytochrome c peroxidase